MHPHVVPALLHRPFASRPLQHSPMLVLHCELAVQSLTHFLVPFPSSKHASFALQQLVPQMFVGAQHALLMHEPAPHPQLAPQTSEFRQHVLAMQLA